MAFFFAINELLHPKIPSKSNKMNYDQKDKVLFSFREKLTMTWTTVDDLLQCEWYYRLSGRFYIFIHIYKIVRMLVTMASATFQVLNFLQLGTIEEATKNVEDTWWLQAKR